MTCKPSSSETEQSSADQRAVLGLGGDVAMTTSEFQVTKSLLKGVIDNLPVAVLVFDPITKQVLMRNPAFLKMVQQSDVHSGFDPFMLIADEQTRTTVRSIIGRGFSSMLELRLNLPNQESLALTAISHISVADFRVVLLCFLTNTPVRNGFDKADTNSSHKDLFTSRELEVIKQLSQGHTNDMIAQTLNLSVGTVKNYASEIYRKLDVERRTEAILRIKELQLAN